jgi:phenylalanyl-tRNA synthetase beta chain
VTLQPRDRTLTDAEIETISQKIISEVARATGATLRS